MSDDQGSITTEVRGNLFFDRFKPARQIQRLYTDHGAPVG